jgi:hypothetical protein
MNSAMKPIYEAAGGSGHSALPNELEAVARAGFVVNNGRLFLAKPEHTSPPAEDMDDCEAERWVNKIHLDTATPATDDRWRAELLAAGLELARRLLLQAAALTALPVQALVALQSSTDGSIDPEIDFATGSLQVYSIRSTRDDLATGIEGSAQPCLALTDRRDQ